MTGPGVIAIRPLSADEVATAVDWAAAEGWNPGLDDAALFRAADPHGFMGLFVDDAMAASISVVAYGTDFGFLGFYICRPDLRGRGLGRRLWDAGMARLAGRTVGLDGVVAQQANYARAGFAAAHRNIRYRGTATAHAADDAGCLLRPVDSTLADAVGAYDRRHFPAPRPRFLEGWLRPPNGRALAALAPDGAVIGYGVIRACRDGHKIGPLFADAPAVAAALAGALADGAGGPVHLDVPEPNGAARALAHSLGMAPVFETARMYRGPAPALPLDRIYGITSFELG